MKKVIFVSGTSFSGTTMLDMILANHPRGFSCGEVHALFRPTLPHHHNPLCGCGEPDCDLWPKVKEQDESRLYETIFMEFPDVDFIVDSSKQLGWIELQTRRLEKKGIEVKNLLIWKSPSEIYESFRKRGRSETWYRQWINYHRRYWRYVDNFATYQYELLVKKPDTLEKVCEYLKIEYTSNREQYWNKVQHTLFGNWSAKVHTRDIDSALVEKATAMKVEPDAVGTKHRSVFYTEPSCDTTQIMAELPLSKARWVRKIEKALQNRDVLTDSDIKRLSHSSDDRIAFSKLSSMLYRSKG